MPFCVCVYVSRVFFHMSDSMCTCVHVHVKKFYISVISATISEVNFLSEEEGAKERKEAGRSREMASVHTLTKCTCPRPTPLQLVLIASLS